MSHGVVKKKVALKFFCLGVVKFPDFSAFRFSLYALPWHLARVARTFRLLTFDLRPLIFVFSGPVWSGLRLVPKSASE